MCDQPCDDFVQRLNISMFVCMEVAITPRGRWCAAAAATAHSRVRAGAGPPSATTAGATAPLGHGRVAFTAF